MATTATSKVKNCNSCWRRWFWCPASNLPHEWRNLREIEVESTVLPCSSDGCTIHPHATSGSKKKDDEDMSTFRVVRDALWDSPQRHVRTGWSEMTLQEKLSFAFAMVGICLLCGCFVFCSLVDTGQPRSWRSGGKHSESQRRELLSEDLPIAYQDEGY